MESIAERINEALEQRGMKQSDLVNKTGIGKSSISTYLAGTYEPKPKNIRKIAEALDVNENWLMGYDVPIERTYMFKNLDFMDYTEHETKLDKMNFLNSMSEYYDLLNELGQDEALRRVKELSQLPQYNDVKRKENI